MRINNNLEIGRRFLDENKDKDGIVTLTSGLQYKVLYSKNKEGQSPKITNRVLCDYEGRLIDGTVFDSSYKRGKALEFSLLEVISGWTIALQMMKEGDKWEIYLPSEFAYGRQGAGKDIEANSTLIFIVELIKITNNNPNN
jgi:FKBP-type peptidyl-prolyl cis-trans isomerase FklB